MQLKLSRQYHLSTLPGAIVFYLRSVLAFHFDDVGYQTRRRCLFGIGRYGRRSLLDGMPFQFQ
jgi:hypothetical protein